MDDDIPPLLHPDDMPLVRDQATLCRTWRAMMGPLGSGKRSLWLLFLDAEGRHHGMVTQVEDVPPRPDAKVLNGLMKICGQLVPVRGRLAFLLTRPGSRVVTDDDRTWARQLAVSARQAHLTCMPTHLATDEQLRVLAPDDMPLPESA